MPGAETIRDVLIRVRMQMVDGDAVRKANGALKEYSNGHERVNGKILNGEKKHTEAVRERTGWEKQFLAALDQEKQKLAELEARANKLAAAAQARAAAEAEAAAASSGGGLLAPAGRRMRNPLSFARGVIGSIAAPVAVLAMAPHVISAIGAAARGAREGGLAGGLRAAAEHFGFVEAVAGFFDAPKEMEGWKAMKDKEFAILNREIESKNAFIAGLRDFASKELEALEKERAQATAARQEFGMMDFGAQQTLRDIAERINRQGLGGISKEELDFVKQNRAFAQLLTPQAEAAAKGADFDEVLRLLGVTERIGKAEEAVKVKLEGLEIVNRLDVKVDGEDFLKALEAKVVPRFAELTDKALARLIERIRTDENFNRVLGAAMFPR
jgi:hypothetical protein